MFGKEKGIGHVTIGTRAIHARGLDRGFWADFYHNAMTAGWGGFVVATTLVFIAINAVFALVYNLGTAPVTQIRDGDYLHYFFFSVETLATVGYGDFHPQTIFGHAVASIESFTGLFFSAGLTGLVFSRIARPRARFIFAKVFVVTSHNGKPTLIVRMANARLSFISGATAKLWVIRKRQNAEGVSFRGFEELALERSENPVFALTWTLFHALDERSPIGGMSEAELRVADASFLVTVTGHDDSAAQTVYSRQPYNLDDLRWDHRYVDILSTDEQGRTWIDYGLLHDVEPIDAQPASASSPS